MTLSQRQQYRQHYNKWYNINNWEQRLWYTAKQRAEKRNLEFTIQKTDIKIPTHCPYLKIELTKGNGRDVSTASLDRIDPLIGYIPTNIQVISDLANRMKSNATIEQLVQFSKSVLEMYDTSID